VEAATRRILRKETLLLALLAASTVPIFLFTRAAAAWVRNANVRAAQIWNSHGGEELRAGRMDAAIESFRNAATKDRRNTAYQLALARALAVAGRDDEARQILLKMRETAPESPEINVELARLGARGPEVSTTILYYHHALYGFWPSGRSNDSRRELHFELVRFLLEHHDRDRALAELLVLESELPAKGAPQFELARLLLRAGDPRRALAQFEDAARMDPKSSRAFAGAGEAAFELGEYGRARRNLEAALRLDAGKSRTRALLETTNLVFSMDPLAPRLSVDERLRRLGLGIDQAALRLKTCIEERSKLPSLPAPELDDLWSAATDLRGRIDSKHMRADPDLARAGVELISGIEEATSRRCGEPTGADLALLLIGRRHGGAES
jgi:tetratricopeptide (TPR) repeat protein